MGFFAEFKTFAMRGNLIDMAVAFVMGGAFGKVVTHFVDDIVMPPIGLLIGNVDFKNLKVVLSQGVAEVKDAAGTVLTPAKAEVALNYGAFINVIVDFILVAFAVFLVIKGINRLKKKEEEKPAAAPEPTKEEILLTEIRDALRNPSK